jgi:hypothetical protein
MNNAKFYPLIYRKIDIKICMVLALTAEIEFKVSREKVAVS